MTSEEACLERTFDCKVCGNGYSESDQLEYHLKKEHTKLDFVAWLKKEACKR